MGIEVSRVGNKLKNVAERKGKMLSEISGINGLIEEQKIEEYVKLVLEEVQNARRKSG